MTQSTDSPTLEIIGQEQPEYLDDVQDMANGTIAHMQNQVKDIIDLVEEVDSSGVNAAIFSYMLCVNYELYQMYEKLLRPGLCEEHQDQDWLAVVAECLNDTGHIGDEVRH